MLSNSRLLFGLFCLIVTAIAGWLIFALPAYCKSEAIAKEVEQFQNIAIRYTDLADEIALQNVKLENSVQSQLAQISDLPSVPDIPSLVEQLKLAVDQEIVWDQQFSLSQSREAVVDSGLGLSYVPVTVDMVSSFSAVIALIQTAESKCKPLRVASVNISRFVESNTDNPDRLRARVVLDLLYNPLLGEGGF